MKETKKFDNWIGLLSISVVAIVVFVFILTVSNTHIAKGTYGACSCTCAGLYENQCNSTAGCTWVSEFAGCEGTPACCQSTVSPTPKPSSQTPKPTTVAPSSGGSSTPKPSTTCNTDRGSGCYLCGNSQHGNYIYYSSDPDKGKCSGSWSCNKVANNLCSSSGGTTTPTTNPGGNGGATPKPTTQKPSSTQKATATPTTKVETTPTSNPQTGTIGIVVAWMVGLSAIVYSFWYFKKNSMVN